MIAWYKPVHLHRTCHNKRPSGTIAGWTDPPLSHTPPAYALSSAGSAPLFHPAESPGSLPCSTQSGLCCGRPSYPICYSNRIQIVLICTKFISLPFVKIDNLFLSIWSKKQSNDFQQDIFLLVFCFDYQYPEHKNILDLLNLYQRLVKKISVQKLNLHSACVCIGKCF